MKKIKDLQKTKTHNKLLLATLILSAAISFTGCSQKNSNTGLNIVAVSPTVQQQKADEYISGVSVKEEGKTSAISVISMIPPKSDAQENTSTEADPDAAAADMMGTASMLKVTAMISAQEIDVLLCDSENAARFAKDGTFMPLDQLLSADELAALDDNRKISFPVTDDDGKETGEQQAACGIDVSGNTEIKEFLSGEVIGVYVLSNAKNMEAAKEYAKSLI